MSCSCVVAFSVLALVLVASVAHAQKQTPLAGTTGCRSARCPTYKCPQVLNCPGGLVLDNERCPCCYRCGLQLGQECAPETSDNETVYSYCDEASGLTCKKTSDNDGTGRAIGVCTGERVQFCTNGGTHFKGCLTCTCVNGAERCERNKDIICPKLSCGFEYRYRPVDKCCPVCSETPIFENLDVPPQVTLLGNSSKFRVKHRSELSIVFRALHLLTVDTISNLSIYHNGRQLLPTSRYLSVRNVRVPLTVNGSNIRLDVVEIRLSLRGVTKKSDYGDYTLAATNHFGTTNTSFSLQVTKRSLRNCSFETDFCDWFNRGNNGGNEIGWLRHSGPTGTRSTGPIAGYGGSGYYIYLETSLPAEAGQEAVLQSVVISAKSKLSKLSFAYHMFGTEVGSLRVDQYLYGRDGTKDTKTLWTQSGNQDNKWHTASVTILPYRKTRIVFVATVGVGMLGDIAIDSIVLS